MKVSDTGNLKPLVGKIMAGLALVALLGSVDAAPASAGEHGDRGGHRDDRGYGNRGHDRGHGYNRGHGGRGYYRGGRWYPAYGYVEPVYVAPPVYYAPPPAPGVSIFLPTIHIR